MTEKNILFINTNSDLSPLLGLFGRLKERGAHLRFLTHNKIFLEKLKEKGIYGKIIKKFNGINNLVLLILYVILTPVLVLLVPGIILHYKYKRKVNTIICIDCVEKLIFTIFARLFNIKLFWIELPGQGTGNEAGATRALLRTLSKYANILTFLELTKKGLIDIKFDPQIIKTIIPGIKLGSKSRQDNIFNRLAESGSQKQKSKFFTLGTALDPVNTQGLETLFQASKKCLTVIPNLQLIVLGEGKGRKGMWWMAKKLEIDGLVWFVGEQINLGKWFNSFDIFISTYSCLRLNDINLVLEAMEHKLPIIGPAGIGLEGLIKQDISGIITKAHESDLLADKIITLKQDKLLKNKLGQNAHEQVDKKHSLDSMVKTFEKKLFNNSNINP